jgi:hypothetical protein
MAAWPSWIPWRTALLSGDKSLVGSKGFRRHVLCSFLALCLKRELETRLQNKGLKAEYKEILRGLVNLREVEAKLQGQSFIFRSTLCGTALPAIRAAGAGLPPIIREAGSPQPELSHHSPDGPFADR